MIKKTLSTILIIAFVLTQIESSYALPLVSVNTTAVPLSYDPPIEGAATLNFGYDLNGNKNKGDGSI